MERFPPTFPFRACNMGDIATRMNTRFDVNIKMVNIVNALLLQPRVEYTDFAGRGIAQIQSLI